MRTKSNILDRSEKLLLKIPKEAQTTYEHAHLSLEVHIDIRDRLTLINRALQAIVNILTEEKHHEDERGNTRGA